MSGDSISVSKFPLWFRRELGAWMLDPENEERSAVDFVEGYCCAMKDAALAGEGHATHVTRVREFVESDGFRELMRSES